MTWKVFRVRTIAVLTKEETEPPAGHRKKQAEAKRDTRTNSPMAYMVTGQTAAKAIP